MKEFFNVIILIFIIIDVIATILTFFNILETWQLFFILIISIFGFIRGVIIFD